MMKIFLSLLLLFYSQVYGQETNFSINEKGEILWQKIFESTTTIDSFIINIKKSGLFINTDTISNTIVGEIKRSPFDPTFIKSLFKKSEIPGYMALNDYSAFFEINFKPGKYRITVKNIKCIGKSDNPKNNVFITKPDAENPLSYFAFKNNKNVFNTTFIKYSIPILDKIFSETFVFKPNSNSDW